MAKKKKDPKSPFTVYQEDNGSNRLLSKEDQNQLGIGENVSTHQNMPTSNHFQQVVQYPYTAQSNVEQSSFPQPQSQPCQPIWMSQHPVYPSLSYPLTYPHPGFPGPWDPSSWWSQPQQSMPYCSYKFPGACGYFPSLPPPLPGFAQRGSIQPPPKLSQKHQQLLEAQSAENVQLWNVVGQLQSELADYKNRLTKLESNISIPNSKLEDHANHYYALDSSNIQKSKRGRPKKTSAPNNVINFINNSQDHSRGRKKAKCDVRTDPKEPEGHQKGKIMEDKVVIQDIPGDEKSDVGLKPFEGTETRSASPTYVGMNSTGNFVWPTNIISKDMGRESFYNDVNLSEHGKTLVTGWSFVERAGVEKGKVEDETENNGSSGAEDTE